jgi:hypothetical protein
VEVFGGNYGKMLEKIFEAILAKCRERFWRQFGKVLEIFLEADL